VIFIGAVLDGAADALGFGAGAGFPPQAAVNTTTDHPAPIADRRAAMFTHMILHASPESTLNVLAVAAPAPPDQFRWAEPPSSRPPESDRHARRPSPAPRG